MPEHEPTPEFPEVYDRFFDRVYGYVRCRVASRDEADELVGRIFERVLDGLAGFSPRRGTLEVWLFAVARNAVFDHYRSWWRRKTFPLDHAAEIHERGPAVHERLEAHEDKRRLLDALDRLDDRERDILGLKYQARLTNREIARVLGLGESNIGVLVFRAIGKLKAALSEGKEAS
jgi:RNA polymerase sigma-70 factor (ECF subfamily)